MSNRLIINQYCDFLNNKGLAKSTIEEVRYILINFISYLSSDKYMIVTKQEQYNYMEDILKINSKVTVYSKVHFISNFLDYCVDQGIVTENIFAYTTINYHYQPSKDILYENELFRFIESIESDQQLFFRERFIIEMFLATLAKNRELLNLKIDQVSFEDESIYFYTTEANRFLIGNDYLYKSWYDYYDFRLSRMEEFNHSHKQLLISRKGGVLTQSQITGLFKKISDRYNLYVTPLKLRRSIIAYLINEGVNLRYIQVLAGHKNIRSTNYYTQLEFKTLQRTIYDYLPRGRIKKEDDERD
ncbi:MULTISPECIES: tyrosine-type recombinase/integrase [unclassified Enterococcus]|uniref:tyrosine-type recombinase/integrase n=1 Tax=unclassified Enterococcus TaxID=2608891 RepID=UPI00190542C2|nr:MULTISPECIES: tyrosine-type recombinase/integrase [unclassified Enterococcus]MBK0036060.1 tyrosine-type recombinase/integrase [Enterococcus sp. S52]MBK0068718.1 tyrosine-type recombinase/integrase [Enterococcus sp. S53]MBK0139311.1 tyrosine-type recombinase/integrase [Enterococcus sp. S76]MBK0142946.1 tyrosine-type recombinase/integrase [Enterococcus sp. S77]